MPIFEFFIFSVCFFEIIFASSSPKNPSLTMAFDASALGAELPAAKTDEVHQHVPSSVAIAAACGCLDAARGGQPTAPHDDSPHLQLLVDEHDGRLKKISAVQASAAVPATLSEHVAMLQNDRIARHVFVDKGTQMLYVYCDGWTFLLDQTASSVIRVLRNETCASARNRKLASFIGDPHPGKLQQDWWESITQKYNCTQRTAFRCKRLTFDSSVMDEALKYHPLDCDFPLTFLHKKLEWRAFKITMTSRRSPTVGCVGDTAVIGPSFMLIAREASTGYKVVRIVPHEQTWWDFENSTIGKLRADLAMAEFDLKKTPKPPEDILVAAFETLTKAERKEVQSFRKRSEHVKVCSKAVHRAQVSETHSSTFFHTHCYTWLT